jgi:hypothetical protein
MTTSDFDVAGFCSSSASSERERAHDRWLPFDRAARHRACQCAAAIVDKSAREP